jgi:hypothetical protein
MLIERKTEAYFFFFLNLTCTWYTKLVVVTDWLNLYKKILLSYFLSLYALAPKYSNVSFNTVVVTLRQN